MGPPAFMRIENVQLQGGCDVCASTSSGVARDRDFDTGCNGAKEGSGVTIPSCLYPEDELWENEYIQSDNGDYQFINLCPTGQECRVIAMTSAWSVYWTNLFQIEPPKDGKVLKMQLDGNVVMYNTSSSPWVPVWSTDTFGSGNRLCIQDDSNVVVYTPNDTPLWSVW